MPYDASGTFTPLRNWEADYNADQALGAAKIGISPVRMDQQDADIAAALTLLATPSGLALVLSKLPGADPGVLNAPWNNGGYFMISKGP